MMLVWVIYGYSVTFGGFVGVARRADPYRTALGDRIPAFEDLEGDGR
mgnify:CR=1 FL=1